MKAEILRGMDLLDEKSPGWEQSVVLDQLDQNESEWTEDADGTECGCILVHVFGDYYVGLYELGVSQGTADLFGFVRVSDGYAGGDEIEVAYSTLTAWWKRLIRARYEKEETS